jgi:hypothetical protein
MKSFSASSGTAGKTWRRAVCAGPISPCRRTASAICVCSRS